MRMHWGGRIAVVLLALLCTAACGSVYAQGRRTYPTYPSQRGGIYRSGGYNDPAYSRGYDDGYRQDSMRHVTATATTCAAKGNRDGDRGYDRRYGSRNQWRQVYRDGFAAGCDEGYRNASYQSRRYPRRY